MERNFFNRLIAYQKERFPFLQNGIFILIFYWGIHNLFLVLQGSVYRFNSIQITGFLTLFLVFFQLRLFDEIKDFQVDSEVSPERPVQRGVITLKEIKILAGIVTSLIIILNAFYGFDNLIKTLSMEAFIFLMLKEFFVGDKLRGNRLIYASLHMLVMPFMGAYIGGHTGYPCFSCGSLIVFAITYLAGFVIEVGRKIEAPESEKPGVDNYSKLLGAKGATYLYLTIVALFSALSSIVISRYRLLLVLPVIIGYFVVLLIGIKFLRYLKSGMPERMNLAGQLLLMLVLAVFLVLPFWR